MKFKGIFIFICIIICVALFGTNMLDHILSFGKEKSSSGKEQTFISKEKKQAPGLNRPNGLTKLDTVLYYSMTQVEYEKKANECEANYLRTGKREFKIKSTRYLDSAQYFSNLVLKISR